jgi:hypothetical protein
MPKKQRTLDVGMVSRSRVSLLAFKMLDAIQDEPLEHMVPAVGLVLEALCEVKNLSRGDVMIAVNNMLRTTGLADDNYVAALRMFIKDDVPDVRRT